MIQIYTASNPDIVKNGIIINPISCEISPKINAENELVMEFPIDDELYKYIQNNSFISVPTPDFSENQLYRIYDTKKSMSGNKITAYARHIQFDLSKKVIFNKSLSNATGQQALDTILINTGFTGHSNISIKNTIQYKLRNTMNAINGTEADSFTSCYGGEISCNNYDMTINTKRGSDKGIRVTFGYNLEDVEEDLNFDDVITRLYPYSGDLTLSGVAHYVDSPLVNTLGVLEDSIEFSDIKVKENVDDTEGYATIADAQAEMIRRCNEMFEKGLDKITANYVVKMQDLSKTTEYKRLGYDVLEKICLGDVVHCYNKNIDIEVEVRCISYKWDCINEEYIEIELGQFTSNYVELQNNKIDNLDKTIKDTDQKVDDTKEELKDDIQEVTDATNGLKIIFEKTVTGIELSVTNLAEGTTAKFTLTDKEIAARVKNSEFESYIIETADKIASMVAKGEFSSLIEQYFDSVVIAIKNATNMNAIFNTSGLTLENGGLYVKGSGGTLMYFRDDGVGVMKELLVDDIRVYDGDNASGLKSTFANMHAYFESLSTGSLDVVGSKNCLQNTANYGQRRINAYETAEYYFGDIGEGTIKNGECIVYIDDILGECINTKINYQVFVQAYNGLILTIERYESYFIVKGTDNTEFAWELKAKRKGYENIRLEQKVFDEDSRISRVNFEEDFRVEDNLNDFYVELNATDNTSLENSLLTTDNKTEQYLMGVI